MDIILLSVILILVAFCLGLFVGKQVFSKKQILSDEEIDSLKSNLIKFETESKSLKEIQNKLDSELKNEKSKSEQLLLTKVSLEENLKFKEEKLQTQESNIKELQQKFAEEFKNISNQILANNSNKINEQTTNTLQNLLKPFKENLDQFGKKVDENLNNQIKDTTSLKEQIKVLNEMNQKISTDANNLATALRGNSKTRGSWGEGILEKILEKSGLVEGSDYDLQKSFSEDAGRLIPDVIVKIPNNRFLIIDSKVSLVAYDKFISANSKEEEENFAKEHVQSIQKHILELSKKDYSKVSDSALDFVLLFIPIEPSLELAMKNNPSIYNEAFDKNILLITPTTLIATLRMVSVIWKQEKQNKNVLEISKQATSMLDKFRNFLKDMENIGLSLDKSKLEFDKAMNKLSTGKGNLITQAGKLEKLGAGKSKNSKQLVEFSVEDEDDIEE